MTSAYTTVFAGGVLIALLWLAFEPAGSGKRSKLAAPLIEAAALALAAGMIGARLAFVALHADYYRARPAETLWFWQGGLAWAGGVAAALCAVWLFARARRLRFRNLADGLIIPAAVVHLATWIGCLLSGCAYGRAVTGGSAPFTGVGFLGSGLPRWPTQLIGALYALLVLAALIGFERPLLSAGVLGPFGFTLIFAGMLGMSFTRADPSLLLAGLRLDTWSAALLTLLGLLWIASSRRQSTGEVSL